MPKSIDWAHSECDICAERARWRLNGFGVVCSTCKPEVVSDLKLNEEEDVSRL